ncbi:MAG: ABC transporter ATP-binding protein, partial [Acidobacteria bacterium]|nr:ABC transporter ATP-binding protein [Acidobacteriota bacterium]
RLLAGALRLDASEIRGEGAGRLLARTFEAETVEQLALSGGLTSALAVIEAAFALYVLSQGAGGAAHALLFAVFLGAVAWLARRLYVKRKRWTSQRLAMTHDLVERMTGHRTRLAQQPEDDWHNGEDQAMESYYGASRELDSESARLTGLLPRAWLLLGAAAMTPAFFGAQSDPAPLAVAIGGLMLGYRAMRSAVTGAASLAGAAIAWNEVRPLFDAAARKERPGALASASPGDALIDARELFVRYDTRPKPILDGVSLSVRRGDWILLEGASGGGKSTLTSLIAGLREPSAGLLLAGGLDRATMGAAAWRRVVSSAPQYHENHVLTGTFAFNLLMGRAWPPAEDDLREARAVCDELGLGPLLERMPGGMEQMIGETGWQLSQGERSRLFMARALLQRSEIAILDESFAALDPENLRQAMGCAQRRAKTLLVVAHP